MEVGSQMLLCVPAWLRVEPATQEHASTAIVQTGAHVLHR